MNYEEIPKYRKKSKAKPPKKCDHKHIFEPCVLEFNGIRYSKEHGITYDNPEMRIDYYYTICGKIGGLLELERWFEFRKVPHPIFKELREEVPNEECKKELDPATRTLPTFFIEDPYFTKYVNINSNQNEGE